MGQQARFTPGGGGGVSVQVIGARALAQKLLDDMQDIADDTPNWLRPAATIIKSYIDSQIRTSFVNPTGRLLGSGRIFGNTGDQIQIGYGRGLAGTTPRDMWGYAMALEAGAKMHWIFPVNASKLHWVDADGEHFRDFVLHPGNRPYHYALKGVIEGFRPMSWWVFGRIESILK